MRTLALVLSAALRRDGAPGDNRAPGRSRAGNEAAGAAIVAGKGKCLTCHRISGKGSRLGPDLTDIGSIRKPEQLATSLLDPNAEILPENRFYRVVTRDGTAITGRLLNHRHVSGPDAGPEGTAAKLPKSELREHGFVDGSPMPSYRTTLSRAGARRRHRLPGTLKGVVAAMRSPDCQSCSALVSCSASSLLAQVFVRSDPERPEGAAELAHLLRELHEPALQPADPDHARKRQGSQLKWVFQARWLDYNQATPLVVDGVMYTTQGNDVLALDATTGKIFWIYPLHAGS